MSTKKLPPMSDLTITVLGPSESLLKSMPKVKPLTKKQFSVIVAHLHHSGDKNEVLTQDQAAVLYEMADGYGQMDIHTLCEMELMWDWSHIRDSQDFTLREIYNRLQEFTKENQS